MKLSSFESRVAKLEKNVYESLKGKIRLELLSRDISEYCEGFASKHVENSMTILDVGGGSGRFARICAEKGHRVILCDISREMLALAAVGNGDKEYMHEIELLEADFLDENFVLPEKVDLLLMHGSAEWMTEPQSAILKAISFIKPGGYLSLLIFNKDRGMLKRGINGLLLEGEQAPLRNKLTPPGAASPHVICDLLTKQEGKMLLQSGIRIFHGFFRQIDQNLLTPGQWLEQELLYYRQKPFSSFGEHTHFIWRAEGECSKYSFGKRPVLNEF